jgi:hypothetical protein
MIPFYFMTETCVHQYRQSMVYDLCINYVWNMVQNILNKQFKSEDISKDIEYP